MCSFRSLRLLHDGDRAMGQAEGRRTMSVIHCKPMHRMSSPRATPHAVSSACACVLCVPTEQQELVDGLVSAVVLRQRVLQRLGAILLDLQKQSSSGSGSSRGGAGDHSHALVRTCDEDEMGGWPSLGETKPASPAPAAAVASSRPPVVPTNLSSLLLLRREILAAAAQTHGWSGGEGEGRTSRVTGTRGAVAGEGNESGEKEKEKKEGRWRSAAGTDGTQPDTATHAPSSCSSDPLPPATAPRSSHSNGVSLMSLGWLSSARAPVSEAAGPTLSLSLSLLQSMSGAGDEWMDEWTSSPPPPTALPSPLFP